MGLIVSIFYIHYNIIFKNITIANYCLLSVSVFFEREAFFYPLSIWTEGIHSALRPFERQLHYSS